MTGTTTMSCPRRALLALVLGSALSACMGTIHSRAETSDRSGRDFFGWPLYDAVVDDLGVMVNGRGHRTVSGLERALAYPSLPVDLVLDTVLLPFDVIAGLSGFDKRVDAAPPEDLPYRPDHALSR